MNRTFILWRLEGKHTIKMLPAMFADALFLLGILGMVALGAAKLFLRDIPAVQITVALVEEDENPLTDMALNYVQGMESISESCRFLQVSKQEGFTMLQEGRAAAVVLLPGGVIEGILTGSNVPVQVYFPENAGIESALFKELTDAGVRMLRIAQAQIYGIYDTAEEYGALERLSVLETEVDRYNLAFALDRLALFREREISAPGELSMIEYAAASGGIFFLLLLGMACYPMMQPYSAVMRKQLAREGISVCAQCFGKWLCGLCCMGTGGFCFGLSVKGLTALSGYAYLFPKVHGERLAVVLMSGTVILLCVTTFVFLIFQAAGNGTAAILALFFLASVMMYFSGGFLPSVFLPDIVRRIGEILPTTYLIEAAGSMYTGTLSAKTAGVLLLYTAGFGIASLAAGRRMP